MTLYFPFIIAALWGLCYVLWERAMGLGMNIPTLILISASCGLVMAWALTIVTRTPFDFTPLHNKSMLLLVAAAMVVTQLAATMSHYVVRDHGSVYASLGELSYPLFIPLFAYLLLGTTQLSTGIVIGGSLIMAGAVIMVLSK